LIKSIIIDKTKDFPVYADIYGINSKKQPLIVFIHGFKGFKDWGGFPYMLDNLSESGYKAVSFNFTHNGVDINNPMEFTRLDLFAENTFSRELKELNIVIDHFYNNAAHYNVDKNRIALIGHSRGGGISILQTADDNRVKCLVTLASVATFDRYGENTKKIWRKLGFIEMENTRTKQVMKMSTAILDDLEKNSENLDIVKAVSKINIPFLIAHGKEDVSVKYSEALTLYDNSKKEKTELMLIENTGHTFGVIHPFAGTTDAFEKVILKMKEFFKKHL
jgi:dipeptidyl aminopeptidase/acylaminoacyl peptidase